MAMERKILIAVPCMDMVSARFASSLAMLNRVGSCTVTFNIGSLIYTSRNKICEMAIKGEFDYIMWFDSDMMFAPDTMERLMEDCDKGMDIVSGLYFRRSHPYSPVLYDKLEITGKGEVEYQDTEDYPDEPFEVAGCGFGCVLMKTDVLFDIAGKEGGLWFAPMGNVGEDCAFCIRARNYGYKIWCDPRVKLGHVGTSIITEGVYRRRK